MNNVYKLIRYNTGTDKKLFIEFAENFDAVIMNSTIAAYSGSAMADLVSIYKNKYIIDPQTYILQQDYDTLVSSTSKKGGIKKSIQQYLAKLPSIFLDTLNRDHRIPLNIIENNIDILVDSVGDFELNYICSFIKEKEYNKYLDFINEQEGDDTVGKPQPKMLVSPYFMLKDSYENSEIISWMDINKNAIAKFIAKFGDKGYPVAGQLIMEKGVLESLKYDKNLLSLISNTYKDLNFENIFIWIDNFSPIESESKYSYAFALLIKELNRIGKHPIMAYGGFDSMLLCHEDAPTRLYGVAQSVGYGEKRQITPVGGGLPVNKYYFPPTHQRLKVEDVSSILSAKGYFDSSKSKKMRAKEFNEKICACAQCVETIGEDFDNFLIYNNSNAFTMRNGINRNRPTQAALEIAARHFLYCKKLEWDNIRNGSFDKLVLDYKANIDEYGRYYDRNLYAHVLEWLKNYAK